MAALELNIDTAPALFLQVAKAYKTVIDADGPKDDSQIQYQNHTCDYHTLLTFHVCLQEVSTLLAKIIIALCYSAHAKKQSPLPY
jgi:hypothetical protein